MPPARASRVDIVGQLDPQIDAARRVAELGGGAELLGQCLAQGLQLAGEHLAELGHMLGEVLLAELRQDHLLQRARARVLLQRQKAGENVPLGDDVADAQRRRDRLGERADRITPSPLDMA